MCTLLRQSNSQVINQPLFTFHTHSGYYCKPFVWIIKSSCTVIEDFDGMFWIKQTLCSNSFSQNFLRTYTWLLLFAIFDVHYDIIISCRSGFTSSIPVFGVSAFTIFVTVPYGSANNPRMQKISKLHRKWSPFWTANDTKKKVRN